MTHLFLTGDIQVGKSTLLNRLLARHPDWRVGGFRTVTRYGDIKNAIGGVYLLPVNGAWERYDADNRIGIRWGSTSAHPFDSFPNVFETVGVSLLECTDGYNVIWMDELGKMETHAPTFCRRVLDILDGPIPVWGVVKPLSTPLLDAVRNHPRTELVAVTPDNRDTLFSTLSSRY